MKTLVYGAMIVWLVLGVTGAALLGQQHLDLWTIAGGPVTFWHGFNQPIDN